MISISIRVCNRSVCVCTRLMIVDSRHCPRHVLDGFFCVRSFVLTQTHRERERKSERQWTRETSKPTKKGRKQTEMKYIYLKKTQKTQCTIRNKTKLNAQMVVNNGRLSFFGWNKMPRRICIRWCARSHTHKHNRSFREHIHSHCDCCCTDQDREDWRPMNANLVAAKCSRRDRISFRH